MPILKGGAKHRKGIKPGGTRITKIKRLQWIGGRTEGEVYLVEFEVVKKTRKGDVKTRKVIMAEKEFKDYEHEMNLKNPIAQFNTMNKLIKLNREKNLGLRILKTIRLRKRKKKRPTLIISLLEPEIFKKAKPGNFDEFKRDMERQQEILKSINYAPVDDAFKFQLDPKTRNGIAVIADFGCLRNIKKNKN